MSKRMQNLILEILQAQPSLRDSKSYLNSFAPRKPVHAPLPHRIQPNQLNKGDQPSVHAEFPLPPNITNPGTLHNPSTTTHAQPDLDHDNGHDNEHDHDRLATLSIDKNGTISFKTDNAATSLPKSMLEHLQQTQNHGIPDSRPTLVHSTSAPYQITPQESAAVPATATDSIVETFAESHTALVKVQGPFTDRQLDSIAEGLVYLKKLGLVSVCVVDHDEWPQLCAEFDREGNILFENEDVELQRMNEWLVSSSPSSSSPSPSSSNNASLPNHAAATIGRRQERLRKRIMAETLRLAESLNRKGAQARPMPQPVVRVDTSADSLKETIARAYQQRDKHHRLDLATQSSRSRPPLVSDDSLLSLRSALAANQIPVIAPYALYENPHQGTLETLCVRADDVMVALARDMVVYARQTQESRPATTAMSSDDDGLGSSSSSSSPPPLATSTSSSAYSASFVPTSEVDMMPLRLMVINREGGIPSHARGGDPHLSINLASEYHIIKNSFIWSNTHPTALRNLDAIADCLKYMPHTSSGVLVTHRSPRWLIANLITNKAAHSPSLPHRLLANKKDVRHTPTILRPGLPIRVVSDFSQLDLDKLTRLLEAAFRRTLDRNRYFTRLSDGLDFVIVSGDYDGAAIVTKEWTKQEKQNGKIVDPIAYLDKFAVLPSLQGSGTVDFLWGALRDEVQGLGLLDALNDNGGKGGFGIGRDLVWKSRTSNPVNRWYYERSNGFVKLPSSPPPPNDHDHIDDNGSKTSFWQLFWCDAEDRLAKLSGESKLSAHRFDQALFNQVDNNDDEDDTTKVLSKVNNSSSFLLTTTTNDPKLSQLPIIAPEESGRLERWAKCVETIPSAWID